MLMHKSKLKWQLATNPFDVQVFNPGYAVKRIHAPLEPSLSKMNDGTVFLHLRTSAEGLNEDGIVVAYLYSTNDGRFFDRSKDGWVEHKFAYGPGMQNYKGGSVYPVMSNFGDLVCHTLIAHTWIGKRPEGKVCDHLDTNKLNLCADNLEWVTPAENIRRGRIAKRLRKVGIDPKLIYTNMLKRIYRLPEESIGMLNGLFLFLSHEEFGDETLDKRTLNACVNAALAETYEKLS